MGRLKTQAETLVPTSVQIAGPSGIDRQLAEAFIRRAFDRAYAAQVTAFMPLLMTLRNDAGSLLAVLGVRPDTDQPLYLEHYLSEPVEQRLADAAGSPVDRASIVEVGNFAVGAAGGGRWLITALTAYLYATGQGWAVFTCGPTLQNAFRRLDIQLVDLAVADPLRLPEPERERWGTYYAQRPRVMAANVQQSHAVLSTLFETECVLHTLWSCALRTGGLAA